MVAPFVGNSHVGGETDWRLGWEADVVAYTHDWNPANAARPAESNLDPLDHQDPGVKYADAAVLRPTRRLASGEDVRGQELLLLPALPMALGPEQPVRFMQLNMEFPADGLIDGAFSSLKGFGFPSIGGKTPTPVDLKLAGVERRTRGAPDGAHGNWLKAVGLIAPGHSGGPVLDRQGHVVAWIVRDFGSPPDSLVHLRHIALAEPCVAAAGVVPATT